MYFTVKSCCKPLQTAAAFFGTPENFPVLPHPQKVQKTAEIFFMGFSPMAMSTTPARCDGTHHPARNPMHGAERHRNNRECDAFRHRQWERRMCIDRVEWASPWTRAARRPNPYKMYFTVKSCCKPPKIEAAFFGTPENFPELPHPQKVQKTAEKIFLWVSRPWP